MWAIRRDTFGRGAKLRGGRLADMEYDQRVSQRAREKCWDPIGLNRGGHGVGRRLVTCHACPNLDRAAGAEAALEEQLTDIVDERELFIAGGQVKGNPERAGAVYGSGPSVHVIYAKPKRPGFKYQFAWFDVFCVV